MSNTFTVDLAERVLASYFFTLIALLLADGFDFTNVTALKAAALAAIPAALSVIKGFIARSIGDPNSASLVR